MPTATANLEIVKTPWLMFRAFEYSCIQPMFAHCHLFLKNVTFTDYILTKGA